MQFVTPSEVAAMETQAVDQC